MSMAEVIKSIEREALREAQSQEISGRNGEPIETAFGVDISKNAVERYAETHLGRKPRNYQEFCAAREAKIIEESKELEKSAKKEQDYGISEHNALQWI